MASLSKATNLRSYPLQNNTLDRLLLREVLIDSLRLGRILIVSISLSTCSQYITPFVSLSLRASLSLSGNFTASIRCLDGKLAQCIEYLAQEI